MVMSPITTTTAFAATLLTLLPLVNAHIGAFHPSMFCANGPQNEVNWNQNTVVHPLYDLAFSDYWFGNGQTNGVSNHCYNWPPPAGQFLELPAGGSFDIEFANNRAFSSMGQFGKKDVSTFPDGQPHPEYDQVGYNNPACIAAPLLHTQDKAHVAGSVFAISYNSEYSKVTPENMVVFSAAYGTPWHSKGTFQVPADLPACPPGGCLCAWGWIPNNCGQPNEYLQLFRCKVTNARPDAPQVATAKPAVWCEDHPDKCTKGAKQLIIWNQKEGNNIQFHGTGRAGEQDDLQQFSPGYNTKMGFHNGPQNDIFVTSGNNVAAKPSHTSSKAPAHTSSKKPTPAKSSKKHHSTSHHAEKHSTHHGEKHHTHHHKPTSTHHHAKKPKETHHGKPVCHKGSKSKHCNKKSKPKHHHHHHTKHAQHKARLLKMPAM